MNQSTEWVDAGRIIPGDMIINLGEVLAKHMYGVFVVLKVARTTYSLATGTPDHVAGDYVFHLSNEIMVQAR